MRAVTIVRRPQVSLGGLPVSPLLQRIYANRNITSPRELETNLQALPPPAALKGMADAVALLAEAVRRRRRILIVADFDADGATSCALALRALRAFGAVDVRFVVPNRFEFGYGLTPEIVAVAARQQPDLLITVDNGIASVDGVAAAKALGMDRLEFRRRNFLETGDKISTGVPIESAVWTERCMDAAWAALGEKTADDGPVRIGRGVACYQQSYGRITWLHDTSEAWVGVEVDGTVVVVASVGSVVEPPAPEVVDTCSPPPGSPLPAVSPPSPSSRVRARPNSRS